MRTPDGLKITCDCVWTKQLRAYRPFRYALRESRREAEGEDDDAGGGGGGGVGVTVLQRGGLSRSTRSLVNDAERDARACGMYLFSALSTFNSACVLLRAPLWVVTPTQLLHAQMGACAV